MDASATRRATGVFFLVNLDCGRCARTTTRSLKRIDGIRSVAINYITDKVYVSYDPTKLTTGQVKQAIQKAGYKAFETTHRRMM